MALTVWITYFVTTIVLSVTPGPGVFSCLSSGLRHLRWTSKSAIGSLWDSSAEA